MTKSPPLFGSAIALSALSVWSLSARPLDATAQQRVDNPIVVLETNLGDIQLELYPERAPKTVERFLQLVNEGFYDEMLFHRVVNDVLIQTGMLDMHAETRGEELEPLRSEADNRLPNQRGTVAMARLRDPHSAKAEFFINVRDNHEYNFQSYMRNEYGYTVFGDVIDGMGIVDEISRLETRRAGILRNFPRQPPVIYRAYVLARPPQVARH